MLESNIKDTSQVDKLEKELFSEKLKVDLSSSKNSKKEEISEKDIPSETVSSYYHSFEENLSEESDIID
jgi:hypothetical protein